MSKYCSGCIKPLDGETLSSWLSHGSSANHDARLASAYYIHQNSRLAEKDFDVEASLMAELSNALQVDDQVLRTVVRPPSCWLIDNPKARLYFCARCLREVYLSTGKIVVLKNWSNCWYTICGRHHCALTEIEQRVDPDVAKEEALLIGIAEGERLEHQYTDGRSGLFRGQLSFLYGALIFQQWCGSCLSSNSSVPAGIPPVGAVELRRLLTDVLMIIMRRRFWERDIKTYLSSLLQRRSWNSLNRSYYGSTFDEIMAPEFCSHSLRARIVAFALMALILDLPGGARVWKRLPDPLKIDDYSLPDWNAKEVVWSRILASEVFDFRSWLKARSLAWHPLLVEKYSYLI
ncbi:TniQ family protein [Pseudomonas viciae]|uniref:TniQ family protein n=1 Tax=Pseudomonas viciae TaxID=2505979 RepID=UPI0022347D81|nr:TniQ family protein [Pseudomonas viciae]UZE84000.1 TniQ family protein [Pseudomonas viciae]